LDDINAISFAILLLLSGERPGSGGTNGLQSLKYEEISIVEKYGLFVVHFKGQIKNNKSPLKKIIIPKELAQVILKRKQGHSGRNI
jgi:hypothetical protein